MRVVWSKTSSTVARSLALSWISILSLRSILFSRWFRRFLAFLDMRVMRYSALWVLKPLELEFGFYRALGVLPF